MCLFSLPCFLKFVNKRNSVGINSKELSHTMNVISAQYCVKII